jgi:diketogulonate reductase-like aldo/keto reductase
VLAAATEHGKSPVQIILRWHVQRGFVAIPKSTHPDHIAANIDVFDFTLTSGEMSAIDALGKDRPMFRMPRWAMAATMPVARPRPRA